MDRQKEDELAGYSTIYVVGGEDGFMGTNSVNPFDLLILVGHGNRMWHQPYYFDPAIR
jgi:hypothetical protein